MALEDYRAWVERACPQDIRGRKLSYGGGTKNVMPGGAFKHWFDACVERGFTVPEWPETYGGAGLDRINASALAEAMRAVGAPLPLFLSRERAPILPRCAPGPTIMATTIW